jgi:hypothetical protein
MQAMELQKWIPHYDPYAGQSVHWVPAPPCIGCLLLLGAHAPVIDSALRRVLWGHRVLMPCVSCLPRTVDGDTNDHRPCVCCPCVFVGSVDMEYYEHVETGETVWEIPNRGWVKDRGALMQRAERRWVL